MGGVEVASVVTSIISAFGSGLDILHRLSGKKRKGHARLPRPAEEQEWLRRSLKTRPVEIRHEYNQQVAKFGHRFELGDGTAQSGLAHTLLVLNTGLMKLINHSLSGKSKSISASQRELYSLSETAAVDTMTALVQLGSRLSLASPPRRARDTKEHRSSGDSQNRRARQPSPTLPVTQKKRPTPTPLLVRGGWIRSKSDLSVVSSASARKARTEDTQKHQRSKSDSAIAKSSPRSKAKYDRATSEAAYPILLDTIGEVDGNRASARHGSCEHARTQRQPSMFIAPADFFNSAETNVMLPASQGPPPIPPKIPLHSRPSPLPRRMRPASTMTFMTASTKMGEIPEPRFPSNEEIRSKPMPYTIPPPLELVEPRRKKGFKFWKRENKRQDIPVY